jgi:hypothetical protein
MPTSINFKKLRFMKTSKLMFALSVVATSASLLLSSCNMLNKDIDNINKGGGTKVDDPTSLFTINGQVESSLLGSIDTIKAFDDAKERLLGTCPVANNGSFSLQIKAQVTSADTIFNKQHATSLIVFALWSQGRYPEIKKRNLLCVSFRYLKAYKKGVFVTSLSKSSSDMKTSDNGEILGPFTNMSNHYIYLNDSLSCSDLYASQNQFDSNLNDTTTTNFQLRKGWTETTEIFKNDFYYKRHWSISASNATPNQITWKKSQ